MRRWIIIFRRRNRNRMIINRQIRSYRVRLINENGSQVGIKSTKSALHAAADAGLDLVLVAPQAKPPVARILNYGKYRFQQQKKAKKARQRQKTVSMKEIRLSPTIDTNDFNTKKNQAKHFIHKGAKVRVSIRFKGRAITHKSIGRNVLMKMANETHDVAKLTQKPKMDGRNMFLMLAPINSKKKN